MRLLNLRFCAYGWLYIVLMDLVVAYFIHTFEGCGKGHDLVLTLKKKKNH